MTIDYRQKLLKWYCSMLLTLLTMLIPALHYWFFRLPARIPYIEELNEIVLPLGGPLSIYPSLFLPLLVWHVGDFSSDSLFKNQLARWSQSYRILFCVLCVHGLSQVLVSSGVVNDLFCPAVDLPENSFQFDGCGSWTPAWLSIIWVGTWISICLLALSKIAISIIFFIKKVT